jgi:hypothetical protein
VGATGEYGTYQGKSFALLGILSREMSDYSQIIGAGSFQGNPDEASYHDFIDER